MVGVHRRVVGVLTGNVTRRVSEEYTPLRRPLKLHYAFLVELGNLDCLSTGIAVKIYESGHLNIDLW